MSAAQYERAMWLMYAAILLLTFVGVIATYAVGGLVLAAFTAMCCVVLGTTHGYAAGRRIEAAMRDE